MHFYDNMLKNIDIAILESIVTFGNNEGRFCKEISFYYDKFKNSVGISEKNQVIAQYKNAFENFAKVFKIIRNIDKDASKRIALINLIFTEYLPEICKEYLPSIIDIYSDKANLLALTHGKATSAFSKIAFLFKPNIYFPYDKTAREALEDFIVEKGLHISLDRNYLNYSYIIDLVFNEFNQLHKVQDYIISKKYLSNFNINIDLFEKRMNALIQTCKLLNISSIDNFIYRRTFDKLLMIYGGFNKRNLVAFTDGIIT